MRLFIAGQPFSQTRARVTRNGTYSSDGAALKAWRSKIEAAALAMVRTTAVKPICGPLSLSLLCLIPSNDANRWGEWCYVKPDFDNLAKPVADVLEKVGVFAVGDQQIADARVRKIWSVPHRGGVLIELLPLLNKLEGYELDVFALDWLAPGEKKSPTPSRRRGRGSQPEEAP